MKEPDSLLKESRALLSMGMNWLNAALPTHSTYNLSLIVGQAGVQAGRGRIGRSGAEDRHPHSSPGKGGRGDTTPRGKARIIERVRSAERGNFGDCEPVGNGVLEMRIHFGPGYRVFEAHRRSRLCVALWWIQAHPETRYRQSSQIGTTHGGRI